MMKHTIEEYLSLQYNAVSPKLDVAKMLSGQTLEPEWREEMLKAVIELMKYTAPSGEISVRQAECVRRDGFTRAKIYYQFEDGLETPAYLLKPEKPLASGAAVLAICGHGYGVKDIVGLTPEGAERTGDPGYHKDFAVALCKRGFTVIAPEPLAFGEMRLKEDLNGGNPGQSSCLRVAMDLLFVGKTLTGERVKQCAAALSILANQPGVDKEHLGVMGISGGGLLTSYISAVDDRVKAAVVSGYGCMFRDSIYDMHHCADNYLPEMLEYCELPDYFSLIAPRPMLWEAGTLDPIFPIDGVMRAKAIMDKVYTHYGAPQNFEIDVFKGDHQISGAMAYDFLIKHLN